MEPNNQYAPPALRVATEKAYHSLNNDTLFLINVSPAL
jgi:hypothetical protein